VYVCTLRLAQALDVSVLMIVPRVFVYVALAAWLLTMTGLPHRLAAGLASASRRTSPAR